MEYSLNSLWTLIFLIISTSCTNNDDGPSPNCFQDENRKVVATFRDIEGMVVAPNPDNCPTIYTLTGGPNPKERKVPLLWPCNLDSEFQEDGLEIVYSGYLFETFENEDICAQQFEIIEIMTK